MDEWGGGLMFPSAFSKTVPLRYEPTEAAHAAHAASEHDDDEDRSPEMLGSLLVYAALVVLSLAALVIVSRHF